MVVLFINPHPDDVPISCLGTVILHLLRGDIVIIFTLTDGGLSGNPEARRREIESLCEELGAECIWWDFEDAQIPSNGAYVREIEAKYPMLRSVDVVYLPWEYDTHPDHRNAAQLGLALTRHVPTVLFYETFTARNFDPKLFVDVESIFERRMKMLQHFFTVHYPVNRDEVVESRAKDRGLKVRKKFAEAFVSDRYLIPMESLPPEPAAKKATLIKN